MGRAYTEEEKEEIKKRIWEEGLKFFHDESAGKLNIRELTANVGISLGSFYNFYPDKEKLVHDICVYRAGQKLDSLRATFAKAENDPQKYIFDIISFNFTDMAMKITTKKIYADAFGEITDENGLSGDVYAGLITDFFKDLETYLGRKAVPVTIDADGLWNAIIALTGMYAVKEKINDEYANDIFELFLKGTICKYVKI